MPTLARTTAIRRAIYGRLQGSALGLGTAAAGYGTSIYDNIAPPSTGYPYVIIGKQSGVPIAEGFGTPVGASSDTQLSSDLWMVKVVDHSTTSDAAEQISGRIQSLLNDWSPGTASVNAGTVQLLRRESDISYTEEDSGEMYRHAGSLYRVTHAYGTASP